MNHLLLLVIEVIDRPSCLLPVPAFRVYEGPANHEAHRDAHLIVNTQLVQLGVAFNYFANH